MKGKLGIASACLLYVLQPLRFVVFKHTHTHLAAIKLTVMLIRRRLKAAL